MGVIAGARGGVARELGLACRQQELLVSIMPLGAVSASLAAGSLIDTFGRKLTIQASVFHQVSFCRIHM